jgi:phosphonoacetaldehyde hydrolase
MLKALVLDWAGTVVDHGSRAPMGAFVRAFAHFGVTVSIADARGPMGMAKRDHIATLMALPHVAAAWQEAQGSAPDEAAIDKLLAVFEPMNIAAIRDHADIIPGALEAIAWARARGMKIGSTTGYTRPIMAELMPLAAAAGYAPDHVVCAGDLAEGRPGPLMMWHAMAALGVWPAHTVVKVDDTPPGIGEGVNAGTWTIGLALTGNICGLSAAELAVLPEAERAPVRARAEAEMRAAGADMVIDSIADLPRALVAIEARLARGERPGGQYQAS